MLKGAAALGAALTGPAPALHAAARASGGFVERDGIRLYYEVHGSGGSRPPLVLLHGGLMAIETAFAQDLLPRFARTRQVIAIEAQGHGHTADRPGPITVDGLTADLLAVMDHLRVGKADLLAHSMGTMTAIGAALARPGMVRSMTLLSTSFTMGGMRPELLAMQSNPAATPAPRVAALLPTPEDFGAWTAHYQRTAPNPQAFQAVMGKLHQLTAGWPGWSAAQLGSITASTLIAVGDRDFILPAHAAEMAGLLPNGRLTVLPATTHLGILRRGAWLEPMIAELVAAAPPQG